MVKVSRVNISSMEVVQSSFDQHSVPRRKKMKKKRREKTSNPKKKKKRKKRSQEKEEEKHPIPRRRIKNVLFDKKRFAHKAKQTNRQFFCGNLPPRSLTEKSTKQGKL